MPQDEFQQNVSQLRSEEKKNSLNWKRERGRENSTKIYHQCQEGKRDKLKPLKIPNSHTKLKMILGYYW